MSYPVPLGLENSIFELISVEVLKALKESSSHRI
jgi:hypothetical protein